MKVTSRLNFTAPALMPVVVALLVFIGTSSATHANDFANAQAKVRAVVTQLTGDIQSIKKLYETDPPKYYKRIEKVIIPAIAIDVSARFVLGRHWKTASETQRKAFVSALQMMLINSYSKALIVLDGVTVEYLPDTVAGSNERKQTVRTQMVTKDKSQISVDYVVLKLDNEWIIFDLVIDGLSMMKQLRTSFDTEIKETGLDALTQRLHSVN